MNTPNPQLDLGDPHISSLPYKSGGNIVLEWAEGKLFPNDSFLCM